jgi:hypothetical protein
MEIVWASEGCGSIAIAAVAYGREDRIDMRLMRRMEVTAFEGGCNRGGILKICEDSNGPIGLEAAKSSLLDSKPRDDVQCSNCGTRKLNRAPKWGPGISGK